ncbi:hypothetical protein Vretifemale_9011, partial [Volvox reticuliferus]
RSWIEACGKEYALAFHAREPLLLTTPAPTMLLSLEHLSRVFGLPPDECVQLALRNPSFIGLPHAQLQSTVNAVSEVLDIGLQEAGKVVMKCPGLAVRQPEFPVARRVELLGALLPVSKDKLRQMVRQRPQLLSKSPQVCRRQGAARGGPEVLSLRQSRGPVRSLLRHRTRSALSRSGRALRSRYSPDSQRSWIPQQHHRKGEAWLLLYCPHSSVLACVSSLGPII